MYRHEEHFWNLPFLIVFGVDLQAMRRAVSFLWQPELLSLAFSLAGIMWLFQKLHFLLNGWHFWGHWEIWTQLALGRSNTALDQPATPYKVQSSDSRIHQGWKFWNKIHLRSVLQSSNHKNCFQYDLGSKGAIIQRNCICFQWTGMVGIYVV